MTLTEKLIGYIRADKLKSAQGRISDYQLSVQATGMLLRNTRTGVTTILESRARRLPHPSNQRCA